MKIETIADLQKKYSQKIDHLDLDLILANILKKPREFVLAHPEYKIPRIQVEKCKLQISRRMKNEPLAYILNHKEFYGLSFKVTPATLIPRPETELLVETALKHLRVTNHKPQTIIEIGTGSGNIIISIAKNLPNYQLSTVSCQLFGIDISKEALRAARQNAKTNQVSNKIKFLHGDLLTPIIKKISNPLSQFPDLLILANLPYLSKKIYTATSPNVKKYEPKSALYSPKEGLAHYEKLLKQISNIPDRVSESRITCILEISPEQNTKLLVLIKKYLSQAKVEFQKDLAGKWRICRIVL